MVSCQGHLEEGHSPRGDSCDHWLGLIEVRILHVISGIDPQNGGPTTVLLGLAAAQVAGGGGGAILCPGQGGGGVPLGEWLCGTRGRKGFVVPKKRAGSLQPELPP